MTSPREASVPYVDSVDSLTYLKSPIETLAESATDRASDHITIHDLLHAYNVLSSRIRLQIGVVTSFDRPWSALEPLKLHSKQIICVLRRDIQRVLPKSSSSLNSGISHLADVQSSDLAGPIDDYAKQAKDAVQLSHHALRFLSNVFRYPVLQTVFTTHDLNDLFNDLLEVANAPFLLKPSLGKTITLATWILQTQRLPVSILHPKMTAISTLLTRNIDNHPGEHGRSERISDSLKTIHSLLTAHGTRFLLPLTKLIPLVLLHLISPSPDIRLQASHALNGFVLAKIKLPTCQSHLTLTTHVQAFLKAQMSKFKSKQSDVCLSSVIKSALAVEKFAHPGNSPFWAINVLSALIVLSDSSVFTHPYSLKFFLPFIAQTLIHKRSAVRLLQPRIWHCLIWAFSRMFQFAEEPEDGNNSATFKHPNMEVAERAFLLIKQEINGGTGLSLISSMVKLQAASASHPSGRLALTDPISKVITVVDDMICNGDASTSTEGVTLLAHLLGSVGSFRSGDDDQWDCNDILTDLLFDGTLLQSRSDEISVAVRAMKPFEITKATRLSEAEIFQHWDILTSIWAKAVSQVLENCDDGLSSDMLHIWQSLLLVHAQLTQEYGHLTASPAYANQFSSIVTSFITQQTSMMTVTPIKSQCCQLLLVKQLWNVMKSVFSASLLSILAEKLLATILEHSFDLSDDKVKSVWSALCSELMIVGDPAFLVLIYAKDEHQKEKEVKRQLWSALAKILPSSEGFVWQDTIRFLLIPLGAWNMSDHEIELWENIFQSAVSRACAVSIGPTSVVENFVQQLDGDRVSVFSRTPQLTLSILSHVVLMGQDELPIRTLSLVDSVLHELYPPRPELFPTSFRFLHVIRELITSAPLVFVVPILVALRTSLCQWIADRSETLLEDEYNSYVIPLYCDSLSILQRQEPSLDTLNAIASFLASAFVRTPPPALGPLAFATFWKATYHRREEFQGKYPENVKQCLKSFGFAFDDNLVDNLSSEQGTESPSTSIIPDSQISPKYHLNHWRIGIDYLQYPFLHRPSGGSEHTPVTRVSRTTPESRNAFDFLSPISRNALSYNPSLSPEFPTPSKLATHSKLQSPLGNTTIISEVLQPVLNSESARRKFRDNRTDVNQKLHANSNLKRSATHPFAKCSIAGPSTGHMRDVGHQGEAITGNKRKRVEQTQGVRQKARRLEPSIPSIPQVRARSDPISSRKNTLFDGVEVLTYRAFLKQQRCLGNQLSVVPTPGSPELLSTVSKASQERQGDKNRINQTPSASTHLGKSVEQHSDRRPGASDDAKTPPRSQTAPLSTKSAMALPLRRAITTSASLNALQEAYTAVTDYSAQMPAEDLVQATKLVHRIASALNEQMGKKLVGRARGEG